MKKFITLSCIACYAIIAQAQNMGDYRSIKSGNWTDFANVWQRYNGTKWLAATTYPTSADGVITISDTTSVTIDGSFSIDQTVVNAGGQLRLLTNYTVTLGNTAGVDLAVDGQMIWTAGTITGTGTITLHGQLQWSGGNLQVPFVNEGITSIGNCSLYSTFTNNSTVNWYWSANIQFAAGSTFNNNGVFNAYSNNALATAGGGVFNNNKTGVFNVLCTGEMINNITFTNKGVMNFTVGSFYNSSASFTNTKTMNFYGSVFRSNGSANFEAGTKITGTGYITLSSNTMSFNTPVNLPAGIVVGIYGGSILGGTGSINLNGILKWHEGSITVPVTIEPKGVAYFLNYLSHGFIYTNIINNGTINWDDFDINFSNGAIINNGQFNLNSNNKMVQQSSIYKGSFLNNPSGVVTKYSVSVTTVDIPFTNKGTIRGLGTISFGLNLTNTGRLEPGIGTGTGIFATGTQYKNKALFIKVNGPQPGLGFDRLVVNGNADLGADTLHVTVSDTMPAGSYIIMMWSGTRSGSFKVVQLPANCNITYQGNTVLLKVSNKFSDVNPQVDDAIKTTVAEKVFSVFPNPASQNISISFQSKNKSALLQIFDMNGKPLLQRNIDAGIPNNIDISRFVAGSYAIQLTDGGIIRSYKFVKQ